MKICFIRSDKGYPDSRVEKEMYALSKEHEVFLLGWNREESGEGVLHEKHGIHGKEFDYYLIPEPAKYGGGMKSMLGPMTKFWKRAFRWLSENRDSYDAIHVVNFDTAKPAFKAARKFKKKIVYDVFDYYADSYNAPGMVKNAIRNLENKYITKSDVTIICSDERKHQIRGSSPKKLIVVENTPEDVEVRDDFELAPGSDPSKPKVVYAGMLVFDRFLKETSEVMMSRTDVEWHVAGYGVLRPYLRRDPVPRGVGRAREEVRRNDSPSESDSSQQQVFRSQQILRSIDAWKASNNVQERNTLQADQDLRHRGRDGSP